MSAESAAANAYLRTYLAPLQPILDRPDVTDIFVNEPGVVWLERLGGGFERHETPALDAVHLNRLARQIASHASQGISREHPLLSATLPDGARVQIVAPPATRGHLALAIRKHVLARLNLEDLGKLSFFEGAAVEPAAGGAAAARLHALLAEGELETFFRTAVRQRRNIVVCGGTSSGKTTFASALLSEVPREERLVLIEDAPELNLEHPNCLGLVAVRNELGEARVTVDDLMQAALRLRPDRIIMGELRGREAFSFVRAANTGHPGSITTVHADHPAGAAMQIAMMMLQAGSTLSRADAAEYVRAVVDIWVHVERRDGRRRVCEVVFEGAAALQVA